MNRLAAATADTVVAPGKPTRPWATSSYPGATDTTPMELTALGEHVENCYGSRGKWFALQCAADSLIGFVAPRLVTTAVVAVLVFGALSLIA